MMKKYSYFIYLLIGILIALFLSSCTQKSIVETNDSHDNINTHKWRRSDKIIATEIIYDFLFNKIYPKKTDRVKLLKKFMRYMMKYPLLDSLAYVERRKENKNIPNHHTFDIFNYMYLGVDCDSLTAPQDLLITPYVDAETQLPCLIFGMERNAQIFNRIYEDNKEVFFAVVDDSIAEDYGIDLIVNDLVVCFDSVINRPTYQLFFKQFENQLVGKFKEFAQEDYFGRPMYINGKIQYKPQNYDTWVYTFWHRRFKEGTLEISIKILREMQSRYLLRKEKYLYSFWKKRKGKQIKK